MLTSSCTISTSIEESRDDGQAIVRALYEIVKQVCTSDELVAAAPQIKVLFTNLADLMVNAAKADRRNDDRSLSVAESHWNELLRIELNRVCSLNGGREVLEACQQEGLYRLGRSLPGTRL
jgi:hypothetical protein